MQLLALSVNYKRAAVGLRSRVSIPEERVHDALAELREATRQVLSGHIERREDPEAASRLTMALASCRLTLAVDPVGGVRHQVVGIGVEQARVQAPRVDPQAVLGLLDVAAQTVDLRRDGGQPVGLVPA